MTDSIDKWAKKRTWKEKSEEWRAKIKVSQVLNRLQSYALGEPSPAGDKVEMTPSQVKAASVLLSKAMPDLSQADVTQNHEGQRMSYQDLTDRLSARLGEDKAKEMLEALGYKGPTSH